MAILSLDIGGTNTHGVVLSGRRILAVCTVEGNGRSQARRCFRRLARASGGSISRLVLTGGGARRIRPKDFSQAFSIVNEIEALAAGGVYLAGGKDVFVASMGTGTAFVSVRGGRGTHVGGTGVGGGTVAGLSRLLLGKHPDEVQRLAAAAEGTLDLTVGDIAGRGVGRVPARATAANFGKALQGVDRERVAASLINLVGEAVGAMAFFAAKSAGQERRILLCGRVACDRVLARRAAAAIRLFGGRARTAGRGEYCAAIGAALLSSRT